MKIDKSTIQYIVLLMIVALLCFFVSTFCFQLTLISGESMEPSYHSGQLVLLNKLDRDYGRGDCVLFCSETLELNLVKRIAALPGDRVQIKGGLLYLNGEAAEPYPGCPPIDYAGLATQELIIPEGQCFVMGDNFSRSIDSRHGQMGLVALEDIKGKIME